jgi:hypothetical protein
LKERITAHHQPVNAMLHEAAEGGIDFGRRRGVEHEKLERHGSPGGLSVPDLVGRGCAVRVHQEADQASIRQELA